MESIYSEAEIEYLKSQRLARIATATRQGKPDVSPVAFEFDGTHFLVGSHSQDSTLHGGADMVIKNEDGSYPTNEWRHKSVKRHTS